MPLIIRYPEKINGGVCSDIVSNVDFAPTLLDIAGLPSPSYMQGRSFLKLLMGKTPPNWEQIAYHRYWMHKDLQHNVYAHYGVRDQRYKLIYWYNEGLVFRVQPTRQSPLNGNFSIALKIPWN